MSFADHEPVLLDETLALLAIKPDGAYLDVTGGRGGHAAAILARLGKEGHLTVCDYHAASVAVLKERFANDARVTVVKERFSQIFDNLDFSSNLEQREKNSPELSLRANFDGILADFGINSTQLTDSALGIGFQLEKAPLDMRIDDTLEISAADLLNDLPEVELADVFFHLGGERQSRRIARAIAHDRQTEPFSTTDQLRGLCERVLGKFYFRKKIHPATKVFQALRIKVNQELEEVARFLEQAPKYLKPEGRLAVITFHEGEDRLAKEKFRTLAMTDDFRLAAKKVKPSAEEIARNPRARSAHLRGLEKVC